MAMQERQADAGSSIGVIVVTHRAREHLEHCLPPLFRSPLRPRVLVVNSSSSDGTVELAARAQRFRQTAFANQRVDGEHARGEAQHAPRPRLPTPAGG